MRGPAAQASLETILIIAFVLLVGLGVGLPFLENQQFTHAAANVKIALLPYLEQNNFPLRIIQIQPTLDPSNDLTMHVTLRGTMTSDTGVALRGGGGCTKVCQAIDPANNYGTVSFFLVNENGSPYYCGQSGPTPTPITC
ncbi:MAG: hypothetical protein Q8P05_05865 [Candidatus Diapherotrites archaeon]|nr:hypothetical protein [Candidatus Diapherotrites archaeon]